MTYRILVLSGDDVMSLELLTKVRDMVEQGATIIGRKPVSSPSLESYIKNEDLDIKTIADAVWGNINGTTITENSYGRGKMIWGLTVKEVLNKMEIRPDFELTSKNHDSAINFIHRKSDNTDFYFIANLRRNPEDISCVFRVDGKVPEIWDAETGTIKVAKVYETGDGCVRMPLRLDFAGSVFVVFRTPAASNPIQSVVKDNDVIVSTKPFPASQRGRYADVHDNFSLNLWVKPETDITVTQVGGVVSG